MTTIWNFGLSVEEGGEKVRSLDQVGRWLGWFLWMRVGWLVGWALLLWLFGVGWSGVVW